MLTEEVFLQHFDFLINTKEYAHSTLWTIFSMLNSECQSRRGLKLNDYFRHASLVKSTEKGYAPKQSSTFSMENIENFSENASFTGFHALQDTAL